MLKSMLARKYLARRDDALKLTAQGMRFTGELGIDVAKVQIPGRASCISCLDWSERRDHLAGRLGAAYFARFIGLKWARRDAESRAVLFSQRGLAAFNEAFPPQ